MDAQTSHTIPGTTDVQQLQLLEMQREKFRDAGCARSIPRFTAPLGSILMEIGCPYGWGQRAAVLGGFWLVRLQLYNHKPGCCRLSVSAG